MPRIGSNVTETRQKLPPADQSRLIAEDRLDTDTVVYGTAAPFEVWEGDHTSLVHVLWAAKHRGLTLADNADAIAEMIGRSRWLAARIAQSK